VLLQSSACCIEGASCAEYFNLALRKVVLCHENLSRPSILYRDSVVSNALEKVRDCEDVALSDRCSVLRVVKDKWNNPRVYKVLVVNSGIGFGDNGADSQKRGDSAACSRLDPWP